MTVRELMGVLMLYQPDTETNITREEMINDKLMLYGHIPEGNSE